LSAEAVATRHPEVRHLREEEARTGVRVGVWVFLASECVLFASLLGTYVALQGRSVSGPYPRQVLDVPMAAVATYLLLASSLTMALAIASGRAGRMGRAQLYLGLTFALGAGFLGIQGHEYLTLAEQGVLLGGNLFGATFYALTGLHGTHVLIGLLWLAGALVNAWRGRLNRKTAEALEFLGLYWHLVDMVWMVIFPVVYLMAFAR
jgi:heme/copper-type cytochrome/quinol oxidase subunit 3